MCKSCPGLMITHGEVVAQTTHPTHGGAVTVVWQTAIQMCRPAGARFTIFGQAIHGWLALYLIKEGDVKTNRKKLM